MEHYTDYIGNSNVEATKNFIKEYDRYRKKEYQTVNKYLTGLEDISDIYEGSVTDEFIDKYFKNN